MKSSLPLAIIFFILATFPIKAFAATPPPDGFHNQFLKETGGSIDVPDGWHFQTGGTKESIIWTFSKDISKDGSYLTGLRIQFVSLGKTSVPSSIAKNAINDKKTNATILKTCQPEKNGVFIRQCIETLEVLNLNGIKRPFHILTTLSWEDNLGLLVVVIAGAPEEEWEDNAPLFEKMKTINLIDLDYLRKQNEEQEKADIAGATLVYNHVTSYQPTEIDKELHATYDSILNVEDLNTAGSDYLSTPVDYKEPKFLGYKKKGALDEKNVPLKGKVSVFYVISTTGNIVHPKVHQSSDPRLNKAAIETIKSAKFEPAKLNGESIATVAAQEIDY